MKTRRDVLLAMGFLFSAGASVQAQSSASANEPASTTLKPAQGISVSAGLSNALGIATTSKAGAPYSLVQETHRSSTLADGTHIEETSRTAHMYRDSQGRTRMEVYISMPHGSERAPELAFVTIIDPVAGKSYSLNPHADCHGNWISVRRHVEPERADAVRGSGKRRSIPDAHTGNGGVGATNDARVARPARNGRRHGDGHAIHADFSRRLDRKRPADRGGAHDLALRGIGNRHAWGSVRSPDRQRNDARDATRSNRAGPGAVSGACGLSDHRSARTAVRQRREPVVLSIASVGGLHVRRTELSAAE